MPRVLLLDERILADGRTARTWAVAHEGRVEIRDDEGNALPAGEIGEICCRSPGVMRGYWRSPDATDEAIRDGWLLTGDIGYLDRDGYLFIVDRKKDLIIRGGFNVYPRDVEDALVKHPEVQMAAVVGRPSERHGEEVVAFVSLAAEAGISPDQLIAWAREHLSGPKVPRQWRMMAELPRNPTGKVLKDRLTEHFGQVERHWPPESEGAGRWRKSYSRGNSS